ncbi:MAG: hypothetical protein J0H68_08325 [Sphingobacteriia bacterium]|nr:hypothetical protein [Sphingobacteriia bacterium]
MSLNSNFDPRKDHAVIFNPNDKSSVLQALTVYKKIIEANAELSNRFLMEFKDEIKDGKPLSLDAWNGYDDKIDDFINVWFKICKSFNDCIEKIPENLQQDENIKALIQINKSFITESWNKIDIVKKEFPKTNVIIPDELAPFMAATAILLEEQRQNVRNTNVNNNKTSREKLSEQLINLEGVINAIIYLKGEKNLPLISILQGSFVIPVEMLFNWLNNTFKLLKQNVNNENIKEFKDSLLFIESNGNKILSLFNKLTTYFDSNLIAAFEHFVQYPSFEDPVILREWFNDATKNINFFNNEEKQAFFDAFSKIYNLKRNVNIIKTELQEMQIHIEREDVVNNTNTTFRGNNKTNNNSCEQGR